VTGIGFELSSLEKVLWPATGFTKGQMVAYYESVASALLPHLADRPLTLGRFPNGVDQRGFAQTECRGRPEWLRTASIQLRNGQLRKFCLADDRRSLLWIANLNAIEFHMFLGTAAALDVPTAVLFDLDPEPPAGLVDAAAVAVMLRERLAADGLEALVKTTGGSGLHLLVPLNNPHAYVTRDASRARSLPLLLSETSA
jgi:bifunctional non-homologous end joining protein LigD